MVEKDGTRWRLGWNPDSEQLAAMKGYPGTNPPTGAWATLGYAGHATKVVAARWRADRTTDVYGNTMTFTYYEQTRTVAGTSTNYDRANYIDTISYTGHTSGTPAAGYSVVFVRESRGSDDVPASKTDWDDWEDYRLDRVDIKYGSTVVRTYDLGYTMDSHTDGGKTWKTTTLTSLASSGTTTVAPIVNTSAPTVTFTYTDLDNRATNGSNSNEWAYPRLLTINNGWGGISTYTYESDGRPYTSWYNWHVIELDINDDVNANPMKSTFSYSSPCYNDPPYSWCSAGTGELNGYAQSTVTSFAFGGSSIVGKVVHKFYIDNELSGREYETQFQDGLGTILRKTLTYYWGFDTSGIPPFDLSTFWDVNRVEEYLLINGNLTMTNRTSFAYDSTGNQTRNDEYSASDLNHPYRSTVTEYVKNTPPSVWILDTVSRRTLQDVNGVILSEQQYGYNGSLPGVGSPTTNKPDLSRAVNGSQTIDTEYDYDPYGNIVTTYVYFAYGTTSSRPSLYYSIYSTTYDTSSQTYAISTDPPLLPATTTAYDYGLGLPISVTDPNNAITSTSYNGLGRAISIKYQGSIQANVQYTYPTPSGNPLSVSAPFAMKMDLWDETASLYRSSWQIADGLGRVIQTQGPYEASGTSNNLVLSDTAYNAQGQVQSSGLPRTLYVSNPAGAYQAPTWAAVPHSTTTYDALGRVTRVDYPDGSFDTSSYSGLRTTLIDRNSHQKVQENDAFGRMIKVEEYTGSNPYTLYATTQYYYDQRDLLKQVIDTAGNVTTINYDGFGRKIDMTDPDLGNWRYRYDASSNLTAQIDAKRQAINMYYDALNRMIGKTYTAGQVNPDTYQPPTDPGYNGYTVKYYYDAGTNGYGHRTSMIDPSGSTTWTYNALGQVTNGTQNTDNANYTISRTYDAFGRPRTQTLPSTEQLTYSYNAMGALLGLTGTNTYVSQIHYEASGQVTDQQLGNGLIQQNCYEVNTLRLSNIRAYPGAVQSCISSPASSRLNLSYSYQNNGNVSQIVDLTRNETLSYTYDELDRLTSGNGTNSRSYTYSSTGNTITQNAALPNPRTNGLVAWWGMNEASGTRNDSYGTNHLTDNNTVTSTAGKQGNAAQFTLANTEYLNIADNLSLSMGTGARMTACTWAKLASKNSSLVQEFLAKGMSGDWEYMLRYDGRIDRFVYVVSSNGLANTLVEARANTLGSPVIGQWYFVCGGYDGANSWISVDAGARDMSAFTGDIFDGTTELRVGSNTSFGSYMDGSLDEAILYKRSLTSGEINWLYNNGAGHAYADLSLPSGGSTTYTYDTAHKHAVTALSTGESYTYDANGNMTCRVEGGNTYKQDFNVENQLSSVYKMNGNCTTGTVVETTSFVYDGDGNLVKKIKPDLSKTIYIGGVYEEDRTSGGSMIHTRVYYPAGGAMRIDGTLYYVLKDHLGSASVVTNSTDGGIVGEQRYYPFGETRSTTGTMNTDKLHTGQRDTGLGIYYYGARFYSPYINHFVSADTIVAEYDNPQKLNRYSYVANNPLKLPRCVCVRKSNDTNLAT